MVGAPVSAVSSMFSAFALDLPTASVAIASIVCLPPA